MAKRYEIELHVDNSQGEAAAAKQTREFERAERAALKTAQAQERSARKAADEAVRQAQRVADAQERSARKLTEIQAREAQKAADAKNRADTKAADQATRSAERVAQAQVRSAQKAADQVARQAQRAADAQVRSAQKAADQVARQAQRAADAQTRQAQRAAQASVQANSSISASTTSMANLSVASFAKMAIGLGTLKELASALSQAMQEADQHYRNLTGNFIDSRDKSAELATVMGEKPDNAFTLRNAQFNTATGFTADEGLGFRMQFQNSGAQFKGSRISDEEYNQYEEQSGQLAAAKGFSPTETGDLAGSLLGFSDRRGMGNNASEHALGKLNSGLAILGRGKGRNSVLVNQFSMASAAALNEDEMKGSFTDSDEVATAVSVMAEKHDASAAEMVRASIKGLHETEGKAGDMNKKAGITAKTKWADAMKKLAPVVLAEAKARGIGIQDVLRDTYKDEQTAEALATGINRGVEGGIIDDRAAFAQQAAGPAPALDQIDQYQKSERGQDRQAAAQLAENEARKGAQGSEVAVLRKQAEAKLVKERNLDTTWSNFQDKLPQIFTLGILPNDRENRIDREAALMLRKRQGITNRPVGIEDALPTTPEGKSEYFSRQIARTRAMNIDPFTGKPIQPPVGPPGFVGPPAPLMQNKLAAVPPNPAAPMLPAPPVAQLQGQAPGFGPPGGAASGGMIGPPDLNKVVGVLGQIAQNTKPQARPTPPLPVQGPGKISRRP